MMSRKRLKWSSLYALLAAPMLAQADKPVPPEAEFLEYLGKWDTEDEAWIEFLASTDVGKLSQAQSKSKPKPKADAAKSDEKTTVKTTTKTTTSKVEKP